MPAPAVTRLNTVVYGGFSVGGNTNYHLHGVTVSEIDYTTLTLEFQVFINDDTTSTFVSRCTALEAAYRVPNGTLVATLNSNNWINLSHASNTGMLATPSIRKSGGGGDSNNSRIYDCSVKVMLPADLSGKSGRQSSTAIVTEDGAELITLTVSAVYTALASNSALVQAQSAFPTYVASLQSAAGGTWDELVERRYAYDSDNKICTCAGTWRQIPAGGAQSSAGVNDTTLAGVWSEVTTDRVGISADPGGSEPLIKLTVSYGCMVRSSVSTSLRSVYESKIRPHMISIAQSLSGVSRVTAIVEKPGLRPQDNSVQARMVFLAPGASSFIRSDTNVALVEKFPFFFEPVLDGDDYSRDKHNQPGFRGAAVASTVMVLGAGRGGAGSNPFGVHDGHVKRLEAEGFVATEVNYPTNKAIEFDGMGTTPSLRMTAMSVVTLMQFVRIRASTGSGSSAGGNQTRTRPRGGQAGFMRGLRDKIDLG